MAHNARYARLAIEYTKLMNLAARSNFIEIQPVEVQPGWPPEKYIITYRCRGIASINKDATPLFSDFHQVSMYMGSDYPLKEPYLKWLTPIWHPNIDHLEPHHVCTNNVQNWFAAKPLAELVLAMGEMVQYKHYHAKWVSPFPLDRAAAEWVLDVAEPRGLLGPGRPLDERPLLKPQRIRNQSPRTNGNEADTAQKRIARGSAQRSLTISQAPVAVAQKPKRAETIVLPPKTIKFGNRTKATEDTKKLVNTIEPTSPANSSPLYTLEILKDGQMQRLEPVTRQVLTIGRGAMGRPVDLVLEGDLTMSRLHLIIERDDSGSFWITAKGQNPVLVNGRVIPRERSIGIEPGQTIELCSYSVKIR
ncbi:MAG TPA: FHA domain-containing protein [Pyrinomonadaceae bacterium]